MEISLKHQDTQHLHHHHHHQQQQLPSPSRNSSISSCTTTTNSNGLHGHNQAPLQSPKHITRSDSANPYPTTFVQADTSSFKQVVQMLTGSPRATSSTTSATHNHPDTGTRTFTHHSIPPIKSIPKKNQSSGFKLYERRNSLKNLKINPLNPIFAPPSSGFSPRKPEILSPSILDFPALVLSPVTPLIPDPFDRSGPRNYTQNNCTSPMNNSNHPNNKTNNVVDGDSLLFNSDAEEKAIKEKMYYMHPSPANTPREAEPRLLSLFPMTSPRVSGSANPSPS